MPAVIESTLYESPGGAVVGGSTQQNSRDDLRLGYQVTLNSVNVATTYSWSLSFASDSPGTTGLGTPFDGTPSISALLAPQGSTSRDAKFNVDYEGTYLIRLTVDAGMMTEDTQFIRARALTLFGALKLVAAGERRDELGVIPVDATPEGWANDQNANMQRIGILLRRNAQSGRVLFVDSNRGRDRASTANDYTNVIDLPGPETARPEETGIKLRAMAHGDFSTINEAIAYAGAAAARSEPAASATEPYVIIVRPGVYDEDLNLASHIHIVGDVASDPTGYGFGVEADSVEVRTINTGGTGTHVYNPQADWTTDQCHLFNLTLTGAAAIALPVLDVQGGLLSLNNCRVIQNGDLAGQGEAVRCTVSNASYAPNVVLKNSDVITNATTAGRVALTFDAIDGSLVLDNSRVQATSCTALEANASLYQTCSVVSKVSVIQGDLGYIGYASSQEFVDSTIESTGGGASIDVSPFGGGAGSKAGDVTISVTRNLLIGEISFETDGAVGTTSLTQSGTTTGTAIPIVYPDAPGDLVNTQTALGLGEAVKYTTDYRIPNLGPGGAESVVGANQLTATNVQDAIDVLVQALFTVTGSPFYSLDQAYNGLSTLSPPTAGDGLGRTITASGGAVQIQGATAPIALDGAEKDGGLQVEGVIDIGGFIGGGPSDNLVDVGHSEISLNPNMGGTGPFISLGRAAVTNGITGGNRGFGGAVILADVTDTSTPFNLHLRTGTALNSSLTRMGNVYMAAGSLADVATTDLPGDVHLIGGEQANAALANGSVYLAGGTGGLATGSGIWFCGEANRVACTLEAAGVFVGGQAGTIYFTTPDGVKGFTFTGAEDLAATVAILDAGILGAVIAPALTITLSSYSNPSADIVYIGDDQGGLLNTALGDFGPATAAFTAGDYGDKVMTDVPNNGELRVNGDLTVTGTIVGGGAGGFGDYKAVVEADDPYTVLVSEGLVGVTLTASNDITVNLAAGFGTGSVVVIKDEGGNADVGNQKIIIADGGANNIDGAATLEITTAYGAVSLYKAASGHWFIF